MCGQRQCRGALQCNSLERDVLVVLADNASLSGNLTDEVAENKARSKTVQRYDGSATGERRASTPLMEPETPVNSIPQVFLLQR